MINENKKQEILRQVNKETARDALDYLIEKNMAFCWLENGRLLSREDCEKILNIN